MTRRAGRTRRRAFPGHGLQKIASAHLRKRSAIRAEFGNQPLRSLRSFRRDSVSRNPLFFPLDGCGNRAGQGPRGVGIPEAFSFYLRSIHPAGSGCAPGAPSAVEPAFFRRDSVSRNPLLFSIGRMRESDRRKAPGGRESRRPFHFICDQSFLWAAGVRRELPALRSLRSFRRDSFSRNPLRFPLDGCGNRTDQGPRGFRIPRAFCLVCGQVFLRAAV